MPKRKIKLSNSLDSESGKMKNSPITKKIMLALGVIVFGFILLNATFIFDFALVSSTMIITRLLVSAKDPAMDFFWVMPLTQGLFVIVIALASWKISKSKLPQFIKATYLAVPLAIVLVAIGASLYRWPVAVYSLGSLVSGGFLIYLYQAKQPWLYYVNAITIPLALLVMGIMGVDI